jgi:hypothetical protein
MGKKLSFIAYGVIVLVIVVGINEGCGQSPTTSDGSSPEETLSITQEVRITKYNNISVASTESLTLSSLPQSIEFTIYSNYQDKITGAKISINYSAFSDVQLLDSNSRFVVNNPSFSEGQNPISVKVTYSTGQVEYDYLKVIIASI